MLCTKCTIFLQMESISIAFYFNTPGDTLKALLGRHSKLCSKISRHAFNYSYTNCGIYNACAVSTLANESFFADLVCDDKESHGYPKGTNLSRVFGHMVLINHFKHKHDKNSYLSATINSKYEIKLAENDEKRYDEENVDQFMGMY